MLHPIFQWAAVEEVLGSPRNLTVLQEGGPQGSPTTSGRLLRRLTLNFGSLQIEVRFES